MGPDRPSGHLLDNPREVGGRDMKPRCVECDVVGRAVVLDGKPFEVAENLVGPFDEGRGVCPMAVEQLGRLQQVEAAEVAEHVLVVEPAPVRIEEEERCRVAQRLVFRLFEMDESRPAITHIARELVVERLPVGQRVEVVGVDAHDLEAEVAAAVAECGAPAAGQRWSARTY